MKSQLIWDLPTRLFHWLLVLGLVIQWATAEWLDDAIVWHVRIGYVMLGLLVFRLIWGFVGTHYAKFNSLALSPKKTVEYSKHLLQRNSQVYAGHNPIGSWAVIIMLLLLILQAISGLFVSDDIFTEGPYRSVATPAVLTVMEFIHFQLFDLLLVVIGLHVIAVLFYQFYKKQPIINAMITGKKPLVSAFSISSSKLSRALVIALLVAVAVYLAVAVYAPEPEFYY